MTVKGQCNCGSIRVTFDEVLDNCILCYCDNCRRSGGLSSVNILLNESCLVVHDPQNVIRKYTDRNTTTREVLERQFCGTCGSPILSLVLANPKTIFVKASLLNVEDIPQPKKENFPHKKPQWMREVNYR